MCEAPTIEDGFGILIAIKKKFDEGGLKRQRHTMIPLTFKALRLIQDIRKQQASDADWEKKVRRVTKFVHECIGGFKKTSSLQTTAQAGYVTSEVKVKKSRANTPFKTVNAVCN